jgi:ATP-binding cassette subfamily B protein
MPGWGAVRERDVRLPGATEPAVRDVSFHLQPGHSLALVGENGSGKTTIIKLLTRLYAPVSGHITLDGLALAEWEPAALRRRIGVIFQDFARYQLMVGENIGAGDVRAFEDERRWHEAAELASATPFIETMPAGFQTQLGKWFKDGRELSAGSGRRSRSRARSCARSRHPRARRADRGDGCARRGADLRAVPRAREERMVILISHRFSTVRMADQILVIQGGEILERGSHDELMAMNGHYAQLFQLQARGYR